MSSIFKRALSSSFSKDDPAVVNSPKAMSISTKSPSFNDFSLCTQDDAEEFPGTNQAPSLSARSSLESDRQPLSPRWNYIFGPQPSAPRHIPQKATPMQTQDQQGAAKTLPRQPEGKIGGMSYHDYCDLIRSCSL